MDPAEGNGKGGPLKFNKLKDKLDLGGDADGLEEDLINTLTLSVGDLAGLDCMIVPLHDLI